MTKEARIKVPRQVRKDEVFRVRTKISHPMETGWRKGPDGVVVPRNRINTFVCMFNGKQIFKSDFDSGVSTDPYLSFFARVGESGTLGFEWVDDAGNTYRRSAEIEVV